jgi:hypothetical protein
MVTNGTASDFIQVSGPHETEPREAERDRITD